MSTATVECEPVQAALSACLYENPNRPMSLLEMVRFYAPHFVAASNTLGQLAMELRSRRTVPSDESMGRAGADLGVLHGHCQALGLTFSVAHLNRLQRSLAANASFETVLNGIQETIQRIWDELDSKLYLQIETKNAHLYEPPILPFGQNVADSFPSSIDDVLEAGNCLALERYTACVFHLMRVLESALKALAGELGIPYAPSWESYIRQLGKVIEQDWKTMPEAVKAKQQFYKEALGDLQAVKIAWRNPTMHIVRSYGGDEAKKIYDSVHQFMVAITENGLSEA